MMEISTDPDGRVYVRWHAGGAYTVLDRDGAVREEFGMGGAEEWAPLPELPDEDERGGYDDERGGYDDGYEDGFEAATEEAADAVASIGRPAKRAAKAGA